MHKRITLLSLLALAACSLPATVWQKPGVTQEEYADDDAACKAQTSEQNFGVGTVAGENKKEYYERCMTALGYRKAGEEEEAGKRRNPTGMLAP